MKNIEKIYNRCFLILSSWRNGVFVLHGELDAWDSESMLHFPNSVVVFTEICDIVNAHKSRYVKSKFRRRRFLCEG